MSENMEDVIRTPEMDLATLFVMRGIEPIGWDNMDGRIFLKFPNTMEGKKVLADYEGGTFIRLPDFGRARRRVKKIIYMDAKGAKNE